MFLEGNLAMLVEIINVLSLSSPTWAIRPVDFLVYVWNDILCGTVRDRTHPHTHQYVLLEFCWIHTVKVYVHIKKNKAGSHGLV